MVCREAQRKTTLRTYSSEFDTHERNPKCFLGAIASFLAVSLVLGGGNEGRT